VLTLPTFEVEGMRLSGRVTLITRGDSRIIADPSSPTAWAGTLDGSIANSTVPPFNVPVMIDPWCTD
jgi:hypothetical protein